MGGVHCVAGVFLAFCVTRGLLLKNIMLVLAENSTPGIYSGRGVSYRSTNISVVTRLLCKVVGSAVWPSLRMGRDFDSP